MTSLNAQSPPLVVTDYLDYFGLNDDPFAPDLLPFYDGGSRRELFAELLHLCQFSAGVLVVLGEEGMGKSSLKTALSQRFSQQDMLCDLSVPVLSNNEWLLSSIAQLLSVDTDFNHTGKAVADIRQRVQTSEDGDSLKVVMLKNAHNLDAGSLKALLQLAAPGEQSPYRQLHLILFAHPDFEQRLPKGNALFQIFHLPPIELREMQHYLRFRLEAVGFSGIFPFKESDIQFLWDISKGVPGKFHDAAREILIEMASPPPENKPLGLPATHMAAIVLLLAGLILMFFYHSADDEGVARSTTEIAAVPALPLAEPEIEATQTKALSTNTPVLETKPTKDMAVATEPTIEPTLEPAVQTEIERTPTPIPQPAPTREAGPVPKPEQAVVATGPTEKEIDALLAAAEQELAQERFNKPKSASKPETTLGKDEGPRVANLTADETSLLDRSPDNFTLQILASSSRQAVDDFLRRQPNRQDLALFTAKRKGKTFYIVVMGNFSSPDAARLAVNTLPREQRTAGPWPRSFQSVQADIREFRGF